jgi:hypothetical protein
MKFIITFFTTSILLAALSYGFIVAVDPYNKLGNNPFGFETKAVDFARENKFNQLEHTSNKYEAFILGSSASHRYETKELKRLTGLESYNYAVQSTTPEDYLAIVRHILSRHPAKIIILALDFYGMNKNFKTEDMFYASPLKNYLTEIPAKEKADQLINTTYFTLKALGDSFKVVWVNLFGKALHAYLEHGDHIIEPVTPGPIEIKQYTYDNFVFDEKRLEYLRELKRLTDSHHVQLIVFTSPLSYEHLQKINHDPLLRQRLEEYKKIAVDIFGEIYDFNNESIRFYDTKEFFRDSTHPTNEFSTLILNRILGKDHAPENLGVKLTKP